MKKRILTIVSVASIILSAILLVLAFLAGIEVIDRGTTFSNGAICFAMILNIISNLLMLIKKRQQENDDN